MAFGDTGAPTLRVCCGPRCGVWQGHHAIFEAAESATLECVGSGLVVAPTMCQGRCGDGVTLVTPSGDKVKARDRNETRTIVQDACRVSPIISSNTGA